MPEKNAIFLWDSIPEPFRAAVVGAGVAFVRVMYDGREPSILRRLLECTLCGAIALSVASLSQAMGLSGDYSTFVGGAVGLLGADTVRGWARRVGEKRVSEIEGA